MTTYITFQIHKLIMTCYLVFQEKLHLLEWNKLYAKSYEPFPTMQKKDEYNQCQMIRNSRMHMVKQKVYMHISHKLPILYATLIHYRFEVELVEVEWRWPELNMVRFRVPIRVNQDTISDPGSTTGSEGWSGVIASSSISRTSRIHIIVIQNPKKQNKVK